MLLEYKAKSNDIGKSVKQIIEREFSLSSRTLSRLKAGGGIAVNGNAVTVRFVLSEGDLLTLSLIDNVSESIEKTNIPLDIIYEDNDMLVINKPLGMPTHPSQGHRLDTLANAVMYRYRNESFTFRAITRLDGDTTGVVIIARNAIAAQRLTSSLQKGEIKKEYAAVIQGVPPRKSGTIDAPISRSADSIIKRQIHPEGKSAKTHYELDFTRSDGSFSLMRAFPITGRTHQIRLHFAHEGMPIYGDFLYGTPIEGVRAHLHCKTLTLPHPMTKEVLVLTASLPQDIKEIMQL